MMEILGGFLLLILVTWWITYHMEGMNNDELRHINYLIDETNTLSPSYAYNVYEYEGKLFVRNLETKEIRRVR
jgi:hypothetical protein